MSIWNYGRDATQHGTWTIDQRPNCASFLKSSMEFNQQISYHSFNFDLIVSTNRAYVSLYHAAELHNNVTKVFVLKSYLSFSKKNIAWLLSLLWEMETQYKYFQFRFTIWYLLSGHVNMTTYNKTPPVYYHCTVVFSCSMKMKKDMNEIFKGFYFPRNAANLCWYNPTKYFQCFVFLCSCNNCESHSLSR